MTIHIDIMFDDLTEEKQKEIMDELGEDCCADRNWDVFAMTGLDIEEDEDDNQDTEDNGDYCDGCRHLGETTCIGTAENCWQAR